MSLQVLRLRQDHGGGEERRSGGEERRCGGGADASDWSRGSSAGGATENRVRPRAADAQGRASAGLPLQGVKHPAGRKDASGRFVNPWPTWNFPSYITILRLFLMEKNHSNVPSSKEVLDKELPVLEPFFVRSPESVGSVASGLRVTWLGHASVLVEMDGLVVLTDPMFSQRASPMWMLGPKRYRGPPCSVEQLPRVDAVLISHTHYDHLDLATVTALNRRFGSDLRWLVPLGLLDWMHGTGCQNVIQLDWWEN
ncbi:hypothetical protein AALO_G00218530 [Alosa alosa]|uniref:Metallo-beta-lactamase domain-containing protein n=1 Tax=Alosa alosa TaxID=278164 RepID=A0AAV6G3I3_9TELE|nr:hypothetical protein AALO_G00218530 [Alosa alosa]